MPEKETIERAKQDLKSGKSPTTAAGEFVRQEMHHIREGKHGAKNAKQAIAIGLSEARRSGVPIPDKGGSSARATRSSKSSSKRAGSSRSTASSSRSSRSGSKRAGASRSTASSSRSSKSKGESGSTSRSTRAGSSTRGKSSSPKRARAGLKALKRQPRAAASHRALSRQARSAAKKRPASARSAAARKAARTRARASR